jgi:hypothetical protein
MTVASRRVLGVALGLELLGLLRVVAILQEALRGLGPSSRYIYVGIYATLLVWLIVPILVAALALVVKSRRSGLFAFAALTALVYGALTVSAYLGVGPLFFDAVVGAAFLVAGVIFGRAALDDARLHPGAGYAWIGAGAWLLFTAAAVAVAVFLAVQLPPILYI